MIENDTVEKISDYDCMACKLCGNICPVNAISFTEQKDGFVLPRVDEAKCIKCGQCLRKCIANPQRTKPLQPYDMNTAYAAWSTDNSIRMNSTSGGIYYAMASHVLKNKGYLCAAAFTNDYKGLSHIVGNDKHTLIKTMRSKYFQSDMGTIYAEVKKVAETGKQILFVGCPCQTEALRVFLGKDFDNLIICDFICRGVNSPKAYRSFIKGMEEKYESPIKTVHFKNKAKGWTNLTTHLLFKNGQEYYGTRIFDPWINGYVVGHLYMRKSCYHCRYTNTKRYSDITIGDYWGYKGSIGNEDFAGVSCVIANTEKGKRLIEASSSKLIIAPASLDNIVKGNGCLDGSQLEIPKAREEFFDNCEIERFDKLVYRLLGWNKRFIYKRKLKSVLVSMRNQVKTPNAKQLSALILKNMEELENE